MGFVVIQSFMSLHRSELLGNHSSLVLLQVLKPLKYQLMLHFRHFPPNEVNYKELCSCGLLL